MQIFLLNIFGLLVSTYLFFIVTAATLEYNKFSEECHFKVITFYCSYAMILITGMWWVHFTQSCLNFLVGFAVGGWYFRT